MSYKKKLIEVALPLQAISKEAAREKSIRHGHPSTLHLWWARRPLAAARAVLWASLVDDPSAHPDRFPTEEDQAAERQRLFDILTELVKWKNTNNQDILGRAKAEIVKSCDGELPNILDPFCGGGTIPLEAQRLGLPAYGGDLNPVAVLISKAMVEIPPRFAGMPPVNPESRQRLTSESWEGARGLAEDIRYYGQWMRDRAFEKIGHLYPKAELPNNSAGAQGRRGAGAQGRRGAGAQGRRGAGAQGRRGAGAQGRRGAGAQGRRGATVIAWIWARTVQSPDPAWDGHVPLVRSWVLRKRPKKPIVWVEPRIDRSIQTISYEIMEGGSPASGTIKRAVGTCIATGSVIPNSYIRDQGQKGRMKTQLIAVVAEGNRQRIYLPPSTTSLPDVNVPGNVPSIRLSTHPQYMSVPPYGMTHSDDLFTDRQLVALTTFSDLLDRLRPIVAGHARNASLIEDGIRLRDGGSGTVAYAEAVLTYLAFVVDKLADRNSLLCSWDTGKEHHRNTFARQALSMAWAFVEANPFSSSTGNWKGQVTWVAKVLECLPSQGSAEILQRNARARIQSVPISVVSTDPPYYDNVPFADISDFFYVWMRHNLSDIWPDELSTVVTPKTEELVADAKRYGTRQAAQQYFEKGMGGVLKETAKAQNSDFPFSIFYAFKQAETKRGTTVSTGWETFLQALHDSGLTVTRTWPMRTELANRLRASRSAALASSIVIVCRPRPPDAPMATRGELLAALRSELPSALRLLREQAIAPVDMAQSMIGPGMAIFSRYSRVLEADGTAMPVRSALALINQILEETLSEEETEFDYETRWALTWYQQYGAEAGPYGDAETLSQAKNTSVSGVVKAGIATSEGGRVQLIPSSNLDHYNPKTDPNPKVWKISQHLLAGLERSEAEAAALLREVGPGYGDHARQLAYLLYQTADRQGWTQEAVAYNTLVTVWPTLTELAARPVTEQASLLES